MPQTLDRVRLLAKDLRTSFPRSPRDTSIGGYVMAARALDKCRADLCGINGEYNWDCPLDKRFFGFAEIDGNAFREYVATGATDEEVSAWVIAHAKQKDREEVILWNNKERDRRLSDLSPKSQVYMEEYIKKNIPRNRVIHHYFDLYDIEEQRI
jgi:hypothetical protein